MFSLIDDGDDVAVARNLKALAKELGESTPRKDVVLYLTKQTFHSRRECILSESEELSFSMLLEEFLSFSRPYVVSQTGMLVSSLYNDHYSPSSFFRRSI